MKDAKNKIVEALKIRPGMNAQAIQDFLNRAHAAEEGYLVRLALDKALTELELEGKIETVPTFVPVRYQNKGQL